MTRAKAAKEPKRARAEPADVLQEALRGAKQRERVVYDEARHADIYIRDLTPHPRIQRAFRAKWARQLRDALDPNLLGELCCIEDHGKLYVFDGQHRLWACREYLGENQRVPCRIYRALPDEKLAEMFLGWGTQKGLRAYDKWKQSVIANHEVERLIDQTILPRHKLHVTDATEVGGVRAVTALRDVFLRYGGEPTLDRTLRISTAAWNREPEAFDGHLLRGIAILVHRFDSELDDAELARKLAKSGGPARMIGAGRDYAKATGVAVARGMAEKMLTFYNKSRRRGVLTLNGHGDA